MIAMSLCFDQDEGGKGRIAVKIGIAVAAIAAVMLIILFPYASGINSPASWLDIGKKILRIWY
jgi:hypothetical protein